MNTSRKFSNQAHLLLQINNERLNAYRNAAKSINDLQVHEVLEKYADQAMHFADEFIRYTRDEEPWDAGTRKNGSDRTRDSVEQAIAIEDQAKILDAITDGEKESIRSFRDCLEDDMPHDLQNTIIHQIDGMVQAEQDLEKLSGQER